MKRAVIIAKGEVQRVGYRDEVERIARKLEISGFVENIKPYDVRIVAEGEDDNIDRFIKRIRIKKYPIDVEDIEVSFEGVKGEFEYFEIRRGEWQEELGERLDTAGKLLHKSVELGEKTVQLGEKSVEFSEESVRIGHAMLEKQDSVLEKQDSMLEKQDSMLEKQDESIGEIRNVSEKIDRGKEDIVAEISSLREDLRSYMENKFAGIEREITEIKVKIGMV